MKEPELYEIKKWIHANAIIGLVVHNKIGDSWEVITHWELFPDEGQPKRIESWAIAGLVNVAPDWRCVLHLRDCVAKEVEAYRAFVKKEARDLREFARLQRKFA